MKPRANFQRRVAVNDENAMFAGTIKKRYEGMKDTEGWSSGWWLDGRRMTGRGEKDPRTG